MDKYKKEFLEVFKASLGVVVTACEKAAIGRTTYYRWLKEDPAFKEAVEDILEDSIDFVESQLFTTIKGYAMPHDHVHVVSQGKKDPAKIVITPGTKHIGPDTTAIIFYLKTKAKHRGYVERQEIAIDRDITVIYDDRLKAIADADESEEQAN